MKNFRQIDVNSRPLTSANVATLGPRVSTYSLCQRPVSFHFSVFFLRLLNITKFTFESKKDLRKS